jgi:hypothetical protein
LGFRFYRRVRILPGVRVNLSKSGASLSIGGRGAWFTIGPKGKRATFGLPGSGLYWTKSEPWARSASPAGPPPPAPKPRRPGGVQGRGGPDPGAPWRAIFVAALLVAVLVAVYVAAQHLAPP